jgi:ferrochelatase
MKTGILLLNLGTPDSPSVPDVRKYLREFLMDPRVIDINPVGRWFLVNLIIAPFRAPKSAALYQSIWTKEGSPLMIYGEQLKDKVARLLGNDFEVELGMRYQSPSIESAMKKLSEKNVNRIIVLPLYPQYSSAATGSTIDEVNRITSKLSLKVPIKIIDRFWHREEYISCVVNTAKDFVISEYDHVLFSFHGIPERQIYKSSIEVGDGSCKIGTCCDTITEGNKLCYRANCIQTAKTTAQRLNIPKEKYTIAFQSRLGRTPWLQPFSDQVITELAQEGKKKLLVFSPAFVADCLETIHEIGVEYQELFHEHGGDKVQLVPSLNDNEEWAEAVKKILLSELN